MSRQEAKRDVPKAIQAYMDRIGATERNFKRWVVIEETRTHYHRDRYVITLGEDGEIDVSWGAPKELKPTKAEQQAIKAVIANYAATWPKSIAATPAQVRDLAARLKKKDGKQPILFVFKDATGKHVLFVQQRVFDESGKKSDLPWSFWNKTGWEMMEPEGDLPLFGLDQIKTGKPIMFHEGANCAEKVARLVSPTGTMTLKERAAAKLACPWFSDLGQFVHLGWPGGAPNADRVDWGPIKRLAPQRTVVGVCDHDTDGENAASDISRILQRRMKVIRFDERFPRGFDLANEFPIELYEGEDRSKRYLGPSFRDCLESATWATRPVFEDNKLKDYELRSEFIEDWYVTDTPSLFINRSNFLNRYTEDEFNSSQAPFSDVSSLGKLLKRVLSTKAKKPEYDPAQLSGRIIDIKGDQVINVFVPSRIKPKKGDVEPFLDFLTYLIPDTGDRDKLTRWIATLIARPDIRISYSLLMISETQGVGKTTLAEKILMPLVGEHNCSTPSAEQLIDPTFNDWAECKRLVIVGEIYDGESSRPYNRLKRYITDKFVTINRKYQDRYQITNNVHICASSNSIKALKLADDDRRWLVPGITEKPWGWDRFNVFNNWLETEGALPAIAYWAGEFVKKHGSIETGEEAPTTAAKTRTIEAVRSPAERMIFDLGEEIAEAGEKKDVVVRQDVIREWLAGRLAALRSTDKSAAGPSPDTSPEKIAAVLRKCGLKSERYKVGGEKFRIAATFELPPIPPGKTGRSEDWEVVKKKAEDLIASATELERWLKGRESL